MEKEITWVIYVPKSYLKTIRKTHSRDEVRILEDLGENVKLKVPYGFVGPSTMKE